MTVAAEGATLWAPQPIEGPVRPDLLGLQSFAAGRVPQEGLGCLLLDQHNPLSTHAQPALEALDRWLVGNALGNEAAGLIGLGPGLTPSGDDYVAGMLVALRECGRAVQANSLWRWLAPRLEQGTSAISAAHLGAAAAGEAHEALHVCLEKLLLGTDDWEAALTNLDAVGHCSGWDGLAGAAAVARVA
jgi:hypothetical protein